METDEILFVMAHEMGHYRLAHIWKGVLYTTAASFLLLFLAALLMRRAVARFGGRWGFTELHDIASVPLFMVVVTLLSFVGDPVSNYASRTMEHEADTFALEVTHTNDAGARAFLKLGSQNRSNPEPPVALKVMQYSHPPLIERIRFALDYRPWEEGRPNRFYAKVSR
jgi:Zn-dependent protease with chaperone function